MHRKSLSEVIEATFDDPSFREGLLGDHVGALKSKGWELSPEDMTMLHDFVTFKQVVDPKTILEVFSNISKGTGIIIPPPWSPTLERIMPLE